MLVKGVYDDAYNKAIEVQKEKNMTFIHPYDDVDVIAGQGDVYKRQPVLGDVQPHCSFVVGNHRIRHPHLWRFRANHL